MPARVRVADLTASAERGRSIMAGPARLSIVKYLLDNESATRSQLVNELSMSIGGCRQALAQLEADGHVLALDTSPQRYSINRAQVANDLGALFGWVFAGPSS